MEKLNKNILISIVIPVYNAEKHIENSLNKLKKQTFSNYEVLFINDGSVDTTESIILKFIEENNLNWRLISQPNKGVTTARNVGIRNTKGEYILFLDDDDYLADNALSLFYKAITSSSCIDFVFSSYSKIMLNGSTKTYYHEQREYTSDMLIKYFSRRAINPGIGNTLIKKKVIFENNIQFKSYKFGEDNHFFFKLLIFSRHIISIPQILFYYINDENSTTTQEHSLKDHDSIDAALDIIEEYKKNNLFQYLDYLNIYLLNTIKGNAIGYMKTKDYEESILVSEILSYLPNKIPIKLFLSKYRTLWLISLYFFYKYPLLSLKIYKFIKSVK